MVWIMTSLIISKKNEVHLHIESDIHVYYELADYFTFEVPGAKFMPTYKNKYWDGKIRLFNIQNNQIYAVSYTHLTLPTSQLV